jgi:gliding motility associated protien GldN
MNKLVIYFGIVLFLFSMAGKQTNAQILNSAYKRNDIYQKKPMPLPSVREADVFWSKKVWRIIDLREKMNLPLYYPSTEVDGRKSLIAHLLSGIENNQITPYEAALDNDDINFPMTYEQVKEKFGAKATTEEKVNFDTGEREQVVIQGSVNPSDIKQYMIKEEWYFDKQASKLEVRIIGICPIREFVSEGDMSGEVKREKVFWIYYPEARNLLATNLVLNPYNDARQMSFDDLFVKRFFNSYIVKESNVYNNRNISTYLSGKNAMYESKRIEDKIFNFEQDLWEY